MGNAVSKRHTGIELLRIVAMLLICMLHVLGKSGVLYAPNMGGVKYSCAWFMEIVSLCAVNCFALLSGFVGLKSRFRWSRPLSVWIQTVFCCIVITAAFVISGEAKFSATTAINAIFPVTQEVYWYITAYIGTALLTPFINIAVEKSEQRALKAFFTVAFVLCSLLPSLLMGTSFGLKYGYSTLWIILMYAFGAYMKKYDLPSRISQKAAFIVFVCSSLAVTASKVFLPRVTLLLFGREFGGGMFVEYTSPFIIINAVMLLCFFSKLKIKNTAATKAINLLASATLGVYIFHVHPLVFEKLDGAFKFIAEYNVAVMVLAVLGCALAIYVICTVYELIRIALFKLCGVKRLLAWVDSRTQNYIL